jgi:hypothetical protein
VRFEPARDSGAGAAEIPLDRLGIAVRGRNSSQYCLHDRYERGPELVTQDASILDALRAAGFSGVDEAIRRARSERLQRRFLVGAPVAFALLFLAGIPLFLSCAPSSWIGAMISRERERAWFGGERAKTISPVPCDDERTKRAGDALRTIASRLTGGSTELAELRLDLCVADEAKANAFALPGDRIVMTRGLIDEARTVDEVAGVLAHEIGHVHARHSLRSVISGLGLQGGIVLLGAMVGGDFTSWASLGGQFLQLGFSRADESDADERAARYLARAGLDARGLVSFLERASRAETGGNLGRLLAIARTHPPSPDRIARLRELDAAGHGDRTPLSVTLEDLRR